MINNVQLGVAETTIIQSGASETNAILSIVFCNTTLAAKTITVYAYPSGSSAGDGTTIIKDLSIPAGDSYIWTGDEKFILAGSDKISGLASVATSVTATYNYYTLG